MIFEWLGKKSLFGLNRCTLILVLLLVAWVLVFCLRLAEAADDAANREIGAAVQREDDLRETLQRTEEADAARTEIRDDRGAARYEQCLHTARTAENCQRFLPRSPADQR